MKTLLTIFLLSFLLQTVEAEVFKSHSTILSVKDSVDIKTKKLFWWTDWSVILPADGSHRTIEVKKNKLTLEGGTVYTLDKIIKRRLVQVRRELASLFVFNATDNRGEKWTVTICRSDYGIYAIQVENNKLMIVYQ
jgi:hypothetical protein